MASELAPHALGMLLAELVVFLDSYRAFGESALEFSSLLHIR